MFGFKKPLRLRLPESFGRGETIEEERLPRFLRRPQLDALRKALPMDQEDPPAPLLRAPRWRKRPVVVEAMRYDGGNWGEIVVWSQGVVGVILPTMDETHPRLLVETLEGRMEAGRGDWIIRGVAGEFYPCAPAIFAATYEAAE